MRPIAAASYILALGAVYAHLGLVGRLCGFSGDPNDYETMVAFFYGVPLAVAGVICSVLALRNGKIRHSVIPLIISFVPPLYWTVVLVAEFVS